MISNTVYLNGQLLEKSRARVPAFDHGLWYGDGLFETIRVYGGQVPLAALHLERLREGSRVIGLELPWTAGQLQEALEATVTVNALGDGYLRLTVTRGPGEGWNPNSCPKPTLLVAAFDRVPYDSAAYQQGLRAVFSSYKRNPHSPLVRVKSLNYLENILAKQEARERGAQEALLLNLEGRVSEGSMSNIFIVTAGKIITPPKTEGLLPGVARHLVLRLASASGRQAAETPLTRDQLAAADEAFLTSSLLEVMPLTSLEGHPIGTGKPGPLTKQLHQLFTAYIAARTGR